MPEIPQTTSMPRSLSEASLQAQGVVPYPCSELLESEATSNTPCHPAQACQAQILGLFGDYEATNGARLPVLETHVETNTAGNQFTADRERYDTIQQAPTDSFLMLADILSEIRHLQLRLLALERALSNLWYPQQASYWECTSHNMAFTAPDHNNMQAQNDYDPTWPSQSDIFFSDDIKTQE